MREILKTWHQMTFQDIPNAIFSQELAAGVSRCGKLDGKMIDQSGQDHAHVSPSVQPVNKSICNDTLMNSRIALTKAIARCIRWIALMRSSERPAGRALPINH